MKLEIILQGREKIKNFVSSIQFLCKHAAQLIFIASEDTLTVFVEHPILWIDIDILNFATTYAFKGPIEENSAKDYIYFDIKGTHLLFPLDALIASEVSYAELTLVKNSSNVPFLRVFSKPDAEKYKGSCDTQVPVIVVPYEQWCTFKIPRELTFDCSCKTPRYLTFRNHIDIYRRFKSFRFYMNPSMIYLKGGSEIESHVVTFFKNQNPKNASGEPLTEKKFAIIESKRLGSFFHSIHILGIKKLSIMALIKHLKCLKIHFQMTMVQSSTI